jgi:hypothetical protein
VLIRYPFAKEKEVAEKRTSDRRLFFYNPFAEGRNPGHPRFPMVCPSLRDGTDSEFSVFVSIITLSFIVSQR